MKADQKRVGRCFNENGTVCFLRALVVVELKKSYIDILAPPKQKKKKKKKNHTAMELNLFFLASLLCVHLFTDVHCSLELKKKKISYPIVCVAVMIVCNKYIILL